MRRFTIGLACGFLMAQSYPWFFWIGFGGMVVIFAELVLEWRARVVLSRLPFLCPRCGQRFEHYPFLVAHWGLHSGNN